jgi:hypothetical protein
MPGIGIGPNVAFVGGRPFDLINVPNYAFDLDGEKGIVLNGSDAASWTDQASGIVFAQAVALDQPAVVTEPGLNNRTALDFDGANHWMNNASGAAMGNMDDSTWFWVVEPDASGGQMLRNSNNTLYMQEASTKVGFFDATAVRETTVDGTTNGQCMCLTLNSSGTEARMYRDGVELAGSPLAYDGTFGMDSAADITLGAFNGGGSGWMNGRLARLVGFGRLLSAFERSQVKTQLSNFYGTP